METLTNLQELNLVSNHITEIKGMDALVNLESVELSVNQITEIKGLDSLVKLSSLNIYGNPIREDEKYLVGNPIVQYVVSYCREKKQKADRQKKERLEKERVEKEKLEKEAEKARLEKELPEKEWADFTDIGYLLEIGYKSFLFGDDICSKELALSFAIGVFNAFIEPINLFKFYNVCICKIFSNYFYI